jgi:hypothetical protein
MLLGALSTAGSVLFPERVFCFKTALHVLLGSGHPEFDSMYSRSSRFYRACRAALLLLNTLFLALTWNRNRKQMP